MKTIKRERKFIKRLIESENIEGIISDNRFGVYHIEIPSIYNTHQLNVLSGNTTYFSSKWHQNIIKNFDQCWIPDFEDEPNLSGKLGHPIKEIPNLKYIGALSRFEKKDIDILVI